MHTIHTSLSAQRGARPRNAAPHAKVRQRRRRRPPARQIELPLTSTPTPGRWVDQPFLALDLETTGLHPEHDHIIEVGGVRFDRQQATSQFAQLVRCEHEVPRRVQALTGIDPALLQAQPDLVGVLRQLRHQLEEVAFVVAYHVPFDRSFLQAAFAKAGMTLPLRPWVDPLVLARQLEEPGLPMNLAATAKRWGIAQHGAHRALPDAMAAGELLLTLAPHLDVDDLSAVCALQRQVRRQRQREKAERGERRA